MPTTPCSGYCADVRTAEVCLLGVKLHGKETPKRGYCGWRITVTTEFSNPKERQSEAFLFVLQFFLGVYIETQVALFQMCETEILPKQVFKASITSVKWALRLTGTHISVFLWQVSMHCIVLLHIFTPNQYFSLDNSWKAPRKSRRSTQ